MPRNYITMVRHELVWQTRTNNWTEENFEEYIASLEKYSEGSDATWAQELRQKAEFLKQFTWDEVCKYLSKDYKGEMPTITIVREDTYGEYRFTDNLEEIIVEAMREDNFDSDVDSEEYADDYEEELEVNQEDDLDD